jgi:hypothetical protein
MGLGAADATRHAALVKSYPRSAMLQNYETFSQQMVHSPEPTSLRAEPQREQCGSTKPPIPEHGRTDKLLPTASASRVTIASEVARPLFFRRVYRLVCV